MSYHHLFKSIPRTATGSTADIKLNNEYFFRNCSVLHDMGYIYFLFGRALFKSSINWISARFLSLQNCDIEYVCRYIIAFFKLFTEELNYALLNKNVWTKLDYAKITFKSVCSIISYLHNIIGTQHLKHYTLIIIAFLIMIKRKKIIISNSS